MQHNATLAKEGGFECLLDEAFSVSAAEQIFANAPAAVSHIEITIRANPLTMRFEGGDATAGANGHDFSITGSLPYTLTMNQSAALGVSAIGNGGTSTGWISYWGQGT